MAKVWELDLPKHETLILLALTDHAADDGTQIYPSIAYIAWKTGYSVRRIKDIMKNFRDRGILQFIEWSHLGTKHYKVNLSSLSDKVSFEDFNEEIKDQKAKNKSQHSQKTGVQPSTSGVQPSTSGVQPSTSGGAVGITRTISKNHQTISISNESSVVKNLENTPTKYETESLDENVTEHTPADVQADKRFIPGGHVGTSVPRPFADVAPGSDPSNGHSIEGETLDVAAAYEKRSACQHGKRRRKCAECLKYYDANGAWPEIMAMAGV